MSTESPEFLAARASVQERLASSGAAAGISGEIGSRAVVSDDPGAKPAAVPEGASPSSAGEAPAPPSGPAAVAVPVPAPNLQPPSEVRPDAAQNGGGTSLEVIAANEPLEKWGTGGGSAWLAEYERMARLVADAITLPDGLRGKPRDILAIALTGRELGIGFMESTRMIAIIHGRPAIAAELKVKLARREGHDIRQTSVEPALLHGTAVRCVTHNSDIATFTIEDAKAAKLVKAGGAYETYESDMMWARAVTRLIRRHCPEVVGASLRSVEELNGD
jgi:hypothetical protein